ncbi:hypothetical protein C7433_11451 [Pantoea sp. PNA 03-3]|nr:hypothetical protein C7433_11451 [Pantoea sp. PNA 03-3]
MDKMTLGCIVFGICAALSAYCAVQMLALMISGKPF